jgi:hypothetical protein
VSTHNALPGDIIHVGADRRVVVRENRDDGLLCIWYHEGLGPYQMLLPHAPTHNRLYELETISERDSYWDYHPDMQDA